MTTAADLRRYLRPSPLVEAVGPLNLDDWSREELEDQLQALHRALIYSVEDHLDTLNRNPSSHFGQYGVIEAQAALYNLYGAFHHKKTHDEPLDQFVQDARLARLCQG